jgi:predicted PurR-regulated permease PerM
VIDSPVPFQKPVATAPVVPAVSALKPRTRRYREGTRAARRVSRHLLSIRLVLNVFLVLALLFTITIASSLLIPLVLAAFIGLALNPVVAGAAKWHIPRWLTACVVMFSLCGAIGGGIGMLSTPAVNWFHQAPEALRSFEPKIKSLTQQFEAASRATQSLVGGPAARNNAPRSAAVAVTAWDVISTTPKVLASVLTVVLLVFFFLIYGDELLRRAVEISPTFASKRHMVSIVRSIQTEVSNYLLTTAAINTALGVATAGMLWAYGIPDPLLWGAVAMLANFIPYVGAICTATLLALVGLLHFQDATLGKALLPAFTFAGITIIEGNMITPLIQGRRMRLSPVAILLWLLVWGWLWGIPGALLAVPMLTSAKFITSRLRGWQWFAHLIQR